LGVTLPVAAVFPTNEFACTEKDAKSKKFDVMVGI
jgi:hypothetical protein